MAKHTVVLGLGNPVLSDDAVGLQVVKRLKQLLEDEPVEGVEVLESTRAGFELLDLLQGSEHAIIVDCLESDAPDPGRVRKLDLSHFAGSARLNAAHDLNIATAFELARRMEIPMPGTVEIFSVEGGDTRTLSERLTAPVSQAVEPLAKDIHLILKSRRSIRRRTAACSSQGP